jgi:glycosyltransferase involved in cell wall biosynthesis
MLNYEYPPLGGGAANATFFLLRELGKRNDIKIDLVTSSANGIFEKEVITDTISIYKLPVKKKSIHYWTMNEIVSYSLQARSFIKKMGPEKYDLIHAFFGVPCGVLAHRYRKKIPYIVSLRGSDVPGFNERFSMQYIFLNPIIRKVWKDASKVVANSVGLSDLAHLTEPGLPIDIIPNGIEIPTLPGKKVRDDDEFVILSVARLIRRKGIEDLIKAVPDIINDFPCVKIQIIGEGNLEDELHHLALSIGVGDHVEFLGYVPHGELPGFYASSDVFVLPSYNEGMSNTILEAMAAGLPIITTNTGGTSELIQGNGQVISVGKPDAIAEAVRRYIIDPSVKEEHGLRSRAIAESMGWKYVSNQYFNLYTQLLIK